MVLGEGREWIGVVKGRFLGITHSNQIHETMALLKNSKSIGFKEYAFFEYSFMYEDILPELDMVHAILFSENLEGEREIEWFNNIFGLTVRYFRLSKCKWPVNTKGTILRPLNIYPKRITPDMETIMKLSFTNVKIVKIINNTFWDRAKNEQMGQEILGSCGAYF